MSIEPLFDGYKKSRDLRKIVTKETSNVQETFKNVHVFKLEQQRIKQLEIALKLDAEREILIRSGSAVVTHHLLKRHHGNHDHPYIRFLPSNASTSVYPNNGQVVSKLLYPTSTNYTGTSGKWGWPVLSICAHG